MLRWIKSYAGTSGGMYVGKDAGMFESWVLVSGCLQSGTLGSLGSLGSLPRVVLGVWCHMQLAFVLLHVAIPFFSSASPIPVIFCTYQSWTRIIACRPGLYPSFSLHVLVCTLGSAPMYYNNGQIGSFI